MRTGQAQLRAGAALVAVALLGPACKRGAEESPAARAVAPYLRWCEAQGGARNACLVSAARVTGDAAACSRLTPSPADRAACLTAAARTSGRAEACRPLADRDLVLCAFTVAAEQRRSSACDLLDSVHWQGGKSGALCLALARGEPDACVGQDIGPELRRLCLRLAAVGLREPALCTRLGKDEAEVQRCAVAVAVARHAPEECAHLFARTTATAGGPTQRSCEVEAEIARGRYSPCFGDPAACDRWLWVARPCEGTSGPWADDCRIHQAVFGTGPFGCGAVVDPQRRALCGELRDAQEGYAIRVRGADGGSSGR